MWWRDPVEWPRKLLRECQDNGISHGALFSCFFLRDIRTVLSKLTETSKEKRIDESLKRVFESTISNSPQLEMTRQKWTERFLFRQSRRSYG
jgi:hypothetical protein